MNKLNYLEKSLALALQSWLSNTWYLDIFLYVLEMRMCHLDKCGTYFQPRAWIRLHLGIWLNKPIYTWRFEFWHLSYTVSFNIQPNGDIIQPNVLNNQTGGTIGTRLGDKLISGCKTRILPAKQRKADNLKNAGKDLCLRAVPDSHLMHRLSGRRSLKVLAHAKPQSSQLGLSWQALVSLLHVRRPKLQTADLARAGHLTQNRRGKRTLSPTLVDSHVAFTMSLR